MIVALTPYSARTRSHVLPLIDDLARDRLSFGLVDHNIWLAVRSSVFHFSPPLGNSRGQTVPPAELCLLTVIGSSHDSAANSVGTLLSSEIVAVQHHTKCTLDAGRVLRRHQLFILLIGIFADHASRREVISGRRSLDSLAVLCGIQKLEVLFGSGASDQWGFQAGAFSNAFQVAEVRLQGHGVEFAGLAQSVYDMWDRLFISEGW